MHMDPYQAKLPPRERRVQNTAYLVLAMGWAFLGFSLLMLTMLVAGQPMVDRVSGAPAAFWLELLTVAGSAAIGVALISVGRWVLKQYRDGRTAFGSDR